MKILSILSLVIALFAANTSEASLVSAEKTPMGGTIVTVSDDWMDVVNYPDDIEIVRVHRNGSVVWTDAMPHHSMNSYDVSNRPAGTYLVMIKTNAGVDEAYVTLQ